MRASRDLTHGEEEITFRTWARGARIIAVGILGTAPD